MREISFWTQFSGKPAKVVQFLSVTGDIEFDYADVALHGHGLMELQYRDEKGAETHEIRIQEVQSNVGSKRLRIEKRGNFVYLFLRDGVKELHYSGASMWVPLQGSYYVGIGVCSHEKDVVEKATFANVDLETDLAPPAKTTLYST